MSDDPLSTRIRNLQNQQQSHTTAQGKKPLGSLTQLTAMIDAQLLMTGRSSASARGGTMQNSNTHGYDYYNLPQQLQQQRLPRDSMTALMTHNDRFETKIDFKTDAESISKPTGGYHQQQTTHHVAVVLAKPLVQDQITVEYASRIQRLARAIINDDYRPDTICFVQSYAKQSNADNADHGAIEGGGGAVPVVSDCDAGYTYFRHLAASTNLDLDDIVFHLERCSIQNGALDNIANMVKHKRLPVWINQSSAMLSTACSEYNSTAAFSRNRRHQQKLHVQLALVSSDYHLCILNDIHVRSPGQSPLRSFERWPSVESCTATEGSAPFPPSTVQIHTSWTFLYATTASMRFSPSLASSVPFPNDGENYCTFVSTFTSACYKRSQELIPVLQNLRGVVADKEFFQRDNYRVLVQTRRALVTDMERLYQQQPSLAAVHKVMTTCTSSSFASLSTPNNPETDENRHSENERKIPLDVVLEGALLSLGRCLDLVRPAGLLTGSVAARDFRLAVTVLEQAVSQISIACDPDQPFPSAAWGTSTNDNFSEEVSVL